MKKLLKTNAAFVLLACACVPCAWAQTPETSKGAEAVRERRVEAEASRPEVKSSRPDVEASRSKVEASRIETDATNVPDAEAEALRARADAATNPAERGRLRQELAERLAGAGRRAEAVGLLRSMLAEERFDPVFFYNTGNALARLDESEAAADAYRKAVAQRRGNYARAEHNLGVVLTRLGRWDEAEEALTAALKLESYTYAEASYSLGRLHALRGESGLAESEWARTLKLSPDHAAAAAALARSLAEDGDAEQALAVLDSFAARVGRRGEPVPREITVARGEIVAAANVLAETRGSAATTLIASETALPQDSTAILRAVREGRGTRERPFVIDRQAFPLLRDARAARADNRFDEAATLYRRAIKEGGGYLAPANLELGLTLISMRRNEEAAASLLAVVRNEGARYPLVFYHLGRIYEHLGRLSEAGEAYARAADLAGEESPQFFLDLSRVREREGHDVEALMAAERYVGAMGHRTGSAPDWARERVEALRKKAAQGAAQTTSAKQ
ncbi:MAG: protein O-GlcNAc transferase [Acidobacteriota bacterium]|jgi:tetratricopeptide (TPR) repeat protein|nr:protein O-GlcNAc transferase [Acidobacteriota bacterium]